MVYIIDNNNTMITIIRDGCSRNERINKSITEINHQPKTLLEFKA